jgi:hypothetical protein
MNTTIYIPICDDNLWILKPLSYLFDKYWDSSTKIKILGFKKPDFSISDKMSFVSLAPSQIGGSSKWTKYLYNYFVNIPDEYVIFSLEDFFPIDYPNYKLLKLLEDLIYKNNIIGRVDITWDSYIGGNYKTLLDSNDYSLLEVNKTAMYRISTQPAIWKKQYLLNFLNHDWNPWQFEIEGTNLSHSMPEKVVAIGDKEFINFPTKWIHKGAVSRYHPNKINVLGLKIDTIKEMVEKGFFSEEHLQWGQWNGRVPGFYELGGYDFDPSKMPSHQASITNWREYYSIYK